MSAPGRGPCAVVRGRCVRLGPELEADQSWYWWHDVKTTCSAAARALSFEYCCYGWGDLLYFPVESQESVKQLASSFSETDQEVAWPTMVAIMEQRGVTTALQPCAGAPQVYLSWREAAKAPCAHRVDLRTVNHGGAKRAIADEWSRDDVKTE